MVALLVLVLWGGAERGAARAATEPGDFERALALIQDARSGFRATTDRDVAAARREVRTKLAILETLLDSAGSHGAAWNDYLLLERLKKELDGKTEARPDELKEVLDRFKQDYSGLERAEIMQLGLTLERYCHRAMAADDASLREEFVRRLDQLEGLVRELSQGRDSGILQEIAEHLAWFERYEQVPEVVRTVRDLAPAVNLRLNVSRNLLKNASRSRIDRVDPLVDCVLGTTVHGTSHLRGRLEVVPVEGDHELTFQARIRGQADTAGRGHNGPVRMRVAGTASVEAAAKITFDADGFRGGTSHVDVYASTRPISMWTTYRSRIIDRLVSGFARQRAARQEQLSNYIASRHAETRVRRQLEEEVRTRLDVLQSLYRDQFRGPLLRRRMFPRIFRATSEKDSARIDMLLAARTQSGALTPPPDPPPQVALSLQFHETVVNNLADRFLAGRAIGTRELRTFVWELFGHEPKQVEGGEESEFEIVLADQRPLTFRADDSVITLNIRAQRFISRRAKYPPMNMEVRYRLPGDEAGSVLTRLSELEVLPPGFHEQGRRRMSAREIAARRFVSRLLERELASKYQLDTLSFSDSAKVLNSLAVAHMTADNGWICVAAESSGPELDHAKGL